jgi:hypothetical protein
MLYQEFSFRLPHDFARRSIKALVSHQSLCLFICTFDVCPVPQVNAKIAKADHISLTTDAATTQTGDNYIAVTSHHIDETWNLVNLVLAVHVDNSTYHMV